MIELYEGDCLEILPTFKPELADVIITSPPYNLGAKYHKYNDNRPWDEYYDWIKKIVKEFARIIKPDGSLFLNMGFTPREPWTAMTTAGIFASQFKLQNNIIWVKSIIINGKTHGHYQPLNSPRFLNNNWEFIFHFTKLGKRKLNPLLVPYVDELNKKRWASSTGKASEGNVWYIPHESRNQNNEAKHPAVFPVVLAERCIMLHGVTDNMVVVDPFVGTGASMLAALRLSNDNITVHGHGIELDSKYLEITRKRFN